MPGYLTIVTLLWEQVEDDTRTWRIGVFRRFLLMVFLPNWRTCLSIVLILLDLFGAIGGGYISRLGIRWVSGGLATAERRWGRDGDAHGSRADAA